ncbi:uncharacterized protein LOC108193235 [Daucus carota subsp. sativus]|uniref:uncharacterized protein LOC108193235 n=1 Tax=Daucus carota subsp. sativus TaxID=79200 RepID=UPI00308346BE
MYMKMKLIQCVLRSFNVRLSHQSRTSVACFGVRVRAFSADSICYCVLIVVYLCNFMFGCMMCWNICLHCTFLGRDSFSRLSDIWPDTWGCLECDFDSVNGNGNKLVLRPMKRLDRAESYNSDYGNSGGRFNLDNRSEIFDGLDESFNTLSDGMDDKLKEAATCYSAPEILKIQNMSTGRT